MTVLLRAILPTQPIAEHEEDPAQGTAVVVAGASGFLGGRQQGLDPSPLGVGEIGWAGFRSLLCILHPGFSVRVRLGYCKDYCFSTASTAADEQDRVQVGELAKAVQEVTGHRLELALVDQGYIGETAAQAAAEHDMQLSVVRLAEAKHGFVLLPRRWVIERRFGRLSPFRRLARDCERLSDLLAGFHLVAFGMTMPQHLVALQVASALQALSPRTSSEPQHVLDALLRPNGEQP